MRDELKICGDAERSELEGEELLLANKAVELELTDIYEANRRIAIDFDYNKVCTIIKLSILLDFRSLLHRKSTGAAAQN